ncbi:MAG: outer membrane protein assembly factor BamB, partial [Chlamydiales bacterium]
HWPSFRGPGATGIVEGHGAPLEWSVTEDEGVAWRVAVPGLGHSSPVIWGDKLFLTTAVPKQGEAQLSSLYGSEGYGSGDSVEDEGPQAFMLLCFDKGSGELLWNNVLHEGVPKIKRHPKASHASSSPTCDAGRVVAFFGSEGLYCCDHEGKLLWKRDLGVLNAGAPGQPQYEWGFASSPVLHEGVVLVQCDVQDQSFLMALDAADGTDLWVTERDEDSTWSSPTVFAAPEGGTSQVIANGYKHVGGYDLKTGDPLWKLVGGGDVPVPTPVIADGMIFLTSAHGRLAPIYAISPSARGDISMDPEESEALVWMHPRRGIYMQTPLVYDGQVYACSDGGILASFDAATGDMLYRERLGSGSAGFSGSAVATDGLIYLSAEDGEVHVVAAGPEFERVTVNDLGDTCMSTPALSEGVLYFRTQRHLLAVDGK